VLHPSVLREGERGAQADIGKEERPQRSFAAAD